MKDSKKRDLKIFIGTRAVALVLLIITLVLLGHEAVGITVGLITFLTLTAFSYINEFVE